MADANITGSPAIISMVGFRINHATDSQWQIGIFQGIYQIMIFNDDGNKNPKNIRNLLRNLPPEEAHTKIMDMVNNPFYKQGYEDGWEEAKRVFKEENRVALRAVIDAFDEQDSDSFE